MKNIKFFALHMLLFGVLSGIQAQSHLANGEEYRRGNRLISSLSEAGQQLHRPERFFIRKNIVPDGSMSEPEWKAAITIFPFTTSSGASSNAAVRALYDQENIYLFWTVPKSGAPVVKMKEKDGVIVADDYVQVDLVPWLPDSIIHGNGYYYSIAINADGAIWDSYFDPYLDGFFFSSWNSGAEVATKKHSDWWEVEMAIPYSGLDVHSDPGWKWNLEFRHHTVDGSRSEVYNSNIGITVEQDIMVRQPGLVSYYWIRPGFMEEVKPDMEKAAGKAANIDLLSGAIKINGREDSELWKNSRKLTIDHLDMSGEQINDNVSSAKAGLTGNTLCFNLQGDGAHIEKAAKDAGTLGEGMSAQMAGVNGVFVDQSLFKSECFWIVLQPRSTDTDEIHQDYYIIVIDNHGGIRGTHYDKFGTPYRTWQPTASVDLFNTESGWGAEVVLDLRSLDIPVDYSREWGFNIFRNRLVGEDGYELQAWKFTAFDFLNPQKFGRLDGIEFQDISIIRAIVERETKNVRNRLASYKKGNRDMVQSLERDLSSLRMDTKDQLRMADKMLWQIEHKLGILDAGIFYRSAPSPRGKDFPLMDVQFIGAHGWAVGAMGTILRTEDKGRNWSKVAIDSDADLYRVCFVDENNGWAAGGRIRISETNESMRHDQRGGYAYIYSTKDGGKTWQCQFAERGRHLFALDFVDSKTGYVAGERGFFMKTIDGGNTWNVLATTGSLNWLYGMDFIDENNGFAVGLNETLIRTKDGGKTWTPIDASADRRFYGFRPIYRDIHFNGSTGCIVGQNGSILISSDGGETWEPSGTFFKNEIRELMDLRSVQFVTPMQGYAVGELGSRIMFTDDGGKNWIYRPTNQTEWLRSVWADQSGIVIVAGERETVLESEDLGFNWKRLNGSNNRADVLVLMAHGDDGPLTLNSFYAHYALNEGKTIIDVGTMSDCHSSEYEETYNLEHDRNSWMNGVGVSSNFPQFETGNNGANYYHYNQRLWEGEENVVRHMVAAIRAYKPDIIITHDGVFGDYDKPGHKLSGRAGLQAFETAGGEKDLWPELTRLGLEPWQPKKLYCTDSQSYPATIDLSWLADQPLKGTDMTCFDYGNYVIRNFQSQGVYHHRRNLKLSLVKSLVSEAGKETSVFEGL